MGTITKPFTFSASTTILSAQVNSCLDTIYNEFNGSITNANISASAAIADTKLAQITTAGKVAVGALTVSSQATGDILYASSASAWARLGVGTATQVIIGGSTPAWGSIPLTTGMVVQIVNTQTGAMTTGSSPIPSDDSIPQNTEGDEFMTLAVTPTNSSNILHIKVVCHVSNDAGAVVRMTAALFQDATAGALACSWHSKAANSHENQHPEPLVFTHKMTAGTTSATTFKVRAGGDTTGTTTFNGEGGGRKFGGVVASSITIMEIKA